MPLSPVTRDAALTAREPRRRSNRLRLAIAISLLLHLAAILALLVSFPRQQGAELLPPPSPVAMVFESGRQSGPTVPHPSEQTTPSQPVAPSQPAAPQPQAPPQEKPPEETPPAELPAPPQPQQAPPTPHEVQPPPQAPETPPPEVHPAPPPPAPSPPATAPLPSPPLPNEPTPAPLPPPPPRQAPPQPPEITIPPEPILPRPPRPAPAPPPPKAAAKPPPAAFPPPMNYSFGTPIQPLGQPSPRPRPRGAIDLSLGPGAKGQADITPIGPHANDAEGSDWRNALSQWVAEHAYYPPEAVHELQDGDSKVHVEMLPNGKVTRVELIGRSGSIWLDMALVSLFRDQRIPPLPGGETEPFSFDFTMHYILRRIR